jgi:arginyl-tRNA synthetase
VITLDLREAIAAGGADAGFGPSATDPKLRPGGQPGTYTSSIAFSLAGASGRQSSGEGGEGRRFLLLARRLAASLAANDWISQAAVTGGGYITVTVTPQALASVAIRVTAAGDGCVRSKIMRGTAVPQVALADLENAATWEDARIALATELTARLAAAAGASVGAPAAPAAEADGGGAGGGRCARGRQRPVGDTVAFAGVDAVRFALARAIPGKPVKVDPAGVARNSLDNPAYAVRYAHARAVSGVRWAVALDKSGEAASPCLPADPVDWALLDTLSWLPERVAVAARRGRPDEFARYLEDLASAAIAALPFVRPGSDDKLAMARAMAQAAQTGLAAGLGLLGIAAPGRL